MATDPDLDELLDALKRASKPVRDTSKRRPRPSKDDGETAPPDGTRPKQKP